MWLPILLSVAGFVFLAGNAIRIVKVLRMPVPLRWELYPIPRGPRERQRYGGSYFEDSEWWTRSHSTSRAGELSFVAREVLLLKSVREGFRDLWLWSWLLHWGLYLYAAAALFLLIGVSLPPISKLVFTLATLGVWVACPLGLVGSLGLLVMRRRHSRLLDFTTRTSIFNLLLLGSIFATGLVAFSGGTTEVQSIVSRLTHLSGHSFASPTPASYLHLGLVGLFLAYFPFTHMTHAYMKFFTWHGVRWDDTPAVHDRRLADKLAVNLQREVMWAAAHIAGSCMQSEGPQGLKPSPEVARHGTAEAVPLQSTQHDEPHGPEPRPQSPGHGATEQVAEKFGGAGFVPVHDFARAEKPVIFLLSEPALAGDRAAIVNFSATCKAAPVQVKTSASSGVTRRSWSQVVADAGPGGAGRRA